MIEYSRLKSHKYSNMQLNTKEDCAIFLSTASPKAIAAQLKADQRQIEEQGLPSILVHFLPHKSSKLTASIIDQAFRDENGHDCSVPRSIRRLQFDGLVRSIKAYLATMEENRNEESQEPITYPFDVTLDSLASTSEITTAMKVLKNIDMIASRKVPQTEPLSSIIAILESANPDMRYKSQSRNIRPVTTRGDSIRPCYICCMQIKEPHPLYKSLCQQCGAFNLMESELTAPKNLKLTSKIALVTGGRINLGYATVMRLLRCGAEVIVTSRYPFDAEARYSAEPDFEEWCDRLCIIGADFRSSKDAFSLVKAVKELLEKRRKRLGAPSPVLDILVNNAAQTLTDKIAVEEAAIAREQLLIETHDSRPTLCYTQVRYQARVRGRLGVEAATLTMDSRNHQQFLEGPGQSQFMEVQGVGKVHPTGMDIVLQSAPQESARSSWTQKVDEIPYEDLITAQSVNAFVPLILCRELLHLMGQVERQEVADRHESKIDNEKVYPQGYIINVSSREGIFEGSSKSKSKNGFHVHTNMSKAALNMITETEAERAWKDRRVAMNTVDPGYMSADPELAARPCWKPCPIGWEDGAGRVLWPIGMAEVRNTNVWGRFLKHFGSVRATSSR